MPQSKNLNGPKNDMQVKDYVERNIIGALHYDEGLLLYNLARRCTGKGIVVEIGTLLGKSTAYLGFGSKEGPEVKVYTIDPFDGGDSKPRTDFVKKIMAKGNYLQTFKKNMEKAGLSNIVIPIPKRSNDAVGDIKDPIELLFIDGAHRYEFVKADLLNYAPKVVTGGIIALHDRKRDGVRQAIQELVILGDKIECIRTCRSILYYKKK